MRRSPDDNVIFFDARREARSLYWRGWGITEIAEELKLKRATVESWKQREKWDDAPMIRRCEEIVEVRFQTLIAKDKKTGQDFKEIDLLGRQIERFHRCQKYRQSGNEADLNPNIEARNEGPRKKPKRNHLTEDQVEQLQKAFDAEIFDYQRTWWNARDERTRFILKSRQIGATWYFAREALLDALETGRNQIFLSASRNQANIFRGYIVEWVYRVTGVQLTGEHLVLDRGEGEEQPTIYFLGTNYRTAQGYHGNFYFDECFWVHGFKKIDSVASAVASQKRYRETYFSTPSTVAHEAHKKWTGEEFNEGRPKADWTKIETYHAALKGGVRGGDGIWRQIVTIEDAAAGGCDLFDIDRLRRRNAPAVFDNLYMCNFVDDATSMFPFAVMRPCAVDAFDKWRDFDAFALRPFGDREVWIGYDPDESAAGDSAALAILAAPVKAGDKLRVLEKIRIKGLGFDGQAALIIRQLERYNVTYIGIDTTGVGKAVWDIVVKRFPMAKRIDYSVPVKVRMVLKAKQVIMASRFEFDAGDKDIIASFMSIRAELTPGQRMLTYTASRAGDTGHADVAWAIMHAIDNEPLDAGDPAERKAKVEMFG